MKSNFLVFLYGRLVEIVASEKEANEIIEEGCPPPEGYFQPEGADMPPKTPVCGRGWWIECNSWGRSLRVTGPAVWATGIRDMDVPSVRLAHRYVDFNLK